MRCLLARATVLRAPADQSLMHALAIEAEETEAANHILDGLCGFSLFDVNQTFATDSDDDDTGRHYAIKPGIARLVRHQLPRDTPLFKQGHMLAREFLKTEPGTPSIHMPHLRPPIT